MNEVSPDANVNNEHPANVGQDQVKPTTVQEDEKIDLTYPRASTNFKVFDSIVFRSIIMAKREFIKIKKSKHKDQLKKRLLSKIFNEINTNTRKKLKLYLSQNTMFENIILSFIWIETKRVYKTIKLSLVSKFSSNKLDILQKYIDSYKSDCERFINSIQRKIKLRIE